MFIRRTMTTKGSTFNCRQRVGFQLPLTRDDAIRLLLTVLRATRSPTPDELMRSPGHQIGI